MVYPLAEVSNLWVIAEEDGKELEIAHGSVGRIDRSPVGRGGATS